MLETSRLLDDFTVFLTYNEGKSERTVAKYCYHVRALLAYLDKHGVQLAQVLPTEIETFAGLHMHEQGMKPRSRRPVVAALRKFFAWMVRAGHLPRNPAAQLPYPRAGKPLPIPMESRYAEQLLMAPGLDDFLGRRDTAIISLFIGCGLRVSGLAALNDSNLMFHLDEKDRERLSLRVREKGDKERIVPAPDECWALLRVYLGDPELAAIDRSLPNGDQVLFVSTMNRRVPPEDYHGEARRMNTGAIDDLIKRYGRRCGIPADQLHAHAMRHLYGTELAEGDIDLLERQSLMGHVSSDSTKVYTHLAQRRLRQAVDKANPFRRIKSPVSELVSELRRPR